MPERSGGPDPLTLTLDTLRSDVERTPLADSMTVRRRGDQRTRRQAVGGALAVAALVAGTVGVLGGVTGDDIAEPAPPAATETATTVEPPLDLAAAPLLDPADLGAVGVYEGWLANPDPAAADQRLSQCVPGPSSLAATGRASRLYYTDLDARVTEHVLRFADARAANAGLARFSGAFAACDPGNPADVSVVDRPEENVAGVAGSDVAVHASRLSTPTAASEPSYYELGLVREANVLVVLQWHSMGRPDGVDWVWDADRLTAALDRAVR